MTGKSIMLLILIFFFMFWAWAKTIRLLRWGHQVWEFFGSVPIDAEVVWYIANNVFLPKKKRNHLVAWAVTCFSFVSRYPIPRKGKIAYPWKSDIMLALERYAICSHRGTGWGSIEGKRKDYTSTKMLWEQAVSLWRRIVFPAAQEKKSCSVRMIIPEQSKQLLCISQLVFMCMLSIMQIFSEISVGLVKANNFFTFS